MSTKERGPAPRKGHDRRSSDLLTVDELINHVIAKARSRGGRLFLTIFGLIVALIIVVIPLTRSAPAATPAAKPDAVVDTKTVVSSGPAQTTLPTLPLDLFAPHTPSPAPSPTTTSTPSSSSTTTSSSTSTTTTSVPAPTVPPRTTPPTAAPVGPPDTGVVVPVGG